MKRDGEVVRMPRRQFLGRSGAALAGGVAAATGLAACADDSTARAVDPSQLTTAQTTAQAQTYPFRGAHQSGITAAPAAASVATGLDVRVDSKDELADLLDTITETIEHVMNGAPWDARPGGFPPYDTGLLGPSSVATGTSVVVGFGHSLFDERFGLADRKPVELQPMPTFLNDYLVAPQTSHGDLSLVISADRHDAVVHALRQVLRVTRGRLVPRWSKEGFQHIEPHAPGQAAGRNLLGFKDGTVNPDVSLASDMDDVVWVQSGAAEPDWAVGGTYQAIRLVRMMVEFWDRTRLSEQEAIFHRSRDSGAPLGMSYETDEPTFADDAALASHIGRANPRTPGSEANRMLRRGFNYAGGLDANDQLDQGLVFVSYQRSLVDGFITVQRRLDGEALEEYIRPFGGGFFFVPPAPTPGEFIGQRLVS